MLITFAHMGKQKYAYFKSSKSEKLTNFKAKTDLKKYRF